MAFTLLQGATHGMHDTYQYMSHWLLVSFIIFSDLLESENELKNTHTEKGYAREEKLPKFHNINILYIYIYMYK